MYLKTTILQTLASVLVLFAGAATAAPESDADASSTGSAPVGAQFSYGFNDVADQLVIITCRGERGKRFGSGFVATMDGKTYIFTNQHVILGADKISFKTATGATLRPRRVELSMTRDIARLELEAPDGLAISDVVEMNNPVAVFGNSEGAGVGTELYGVVNGVGSELLETSAEFVSGNSGSPVLNQNQEVLGIAAYVRVSSRHAMKEGTQFENKTRRFCYRLTGVSWKEVNWKRYNDKYGKLYRRSQIMTDGIFDIIGSWSSSPLTRVSVDDNPERALTSWAKSHNEVVGKFNRDAQNKRGMMTEYSESLKKLSEVCRGRARQIDLFAEQRDLTGFLRDEFEKQSMSLEHAAKVIDRCGDLIYSYRR